jgi:hypothetical protein
MAPSDEPGGDYVKVAEVAIDSVQPGRTGFVLTGRGSDRDAGGPADAGRPRGDPGPV